MLLVLIQCRSYGFTPHTSWFLVLIFGRVIQYCSGVACPEAYITVCAAFALQADYFSFSLLTSFAFSLALAVQHLACWLVVSRSVSLQCPLLNFYTSLAFPMSSRNERFILVQLLSLREDPYAAILITYKSCSACGA